MRNLESKPTYKEILNLLITSEVVHEVVKHKT